MVSTLSPAPEVGFDVETYPQDKTARSLDPRRGKIGVITLSTKDLTYVIDRKAFRDPPDTEELLDALRSVLSGKPMVAHNAPFDLAFLRRDVGYEHDGPVYDTLVLDAMLFYATGPLAQKDSWRGFVAKDKEQGHKKKLSEVAATRLGVTLDKTEQSSDWGGELSLAMVSYAAEDAAVLLPLKDVLITELENLGMGKIVVDLRRFRGLSKTENSARKGECCHEQSRPTHRSFAEKLSGWLEPPMRSIPSPGSPVRSVSPMAPLGTG